MGCIYIVWFPNGKGYAGKTSLGLEHRKRGHRRAAELGCSNLLHRALRKYGMDNVEWVVEHDGVPAEDLDRLEIETIAWFGFFGPGGYNMTIGGDGGATMIGAIVGEETRRRISSAHVGKVLTEEHRKKIGASLTGKKRGPPSAETVAKMKAAVLRNPRKHTEEAKQRMSAVRKGRTSTMKGRHHTEETRAKLSAFQKTRKRKPLSEEHKAAISKSRIGQVPSLEARKKSSESHKAYYQV